MPSNPQPARIHLPKGWQDCVQSAVLHAISLAHYAIAYARAWAADSINARGCDSLRRTIGSTKRAPCCTKSYASKTSA